MTDPFYGPGGRRVIEPEIRARIAEQIGATPIGGMAEVIDVGGSVTGDERMSGYRERGSFREWLLPLSAKKGLSWRSDPVPESPLAKVAFFLSMGFGNGSPLPQPSGQWDLFVNDRLAVSIRVVNHSQLWRQGECSFAFAANRIETAPAFCSMTLSDIITDEAFAAFGPAALTVPVSWVSPGEAATLRLVPRAEADSTRWVQLATSAGMFVGSDVYRAVDVLTGSARPRVGDYNVYFGDIHTHSGQSDDGCEGTPCGMGSREENYRYARGPGGLDFYALTDHEWQIDPGRGGEYLGLADEFNEDGRFVCLPGFEHTSLLYGHRNVYFRGPGGTVVNTNREGGMITMDPDKVISPRELWAALESNAAPFMTVPHHPSGTSHPLTWEFFHPVHDRLIEVYSAWGSSEYYGDFPRGVSDRYRTSDVRDAIRRQLRFGLIASSDGHDGHPGNAQSPLIKHHHIFHFCGSGRAAVLCENLTREEIFDALYSRRCYATTGPPILLDARVDGELTGSRLAQLSSGKRPTVSVRCEGANGLDHIRIVKNGHVVHTAPCHGEFACDIQWEDSDCDDEHPNSYYVRAVQIDRESAWSSPIWIG